MKNIFSNLVYIILGALILMAPALYNGFPLVYSDTGTYILSGMELIIPTDRPISYGLFIRATSLHISLWFVVFAQCVILSYLLYILLKFIIKKVSLNITFIVVLILLTAFTGIGWYAGQIMPDIFTPICILSISILLFNAKLSRLSTILVSCILVVSISVHLSNFLISALTLLIGFILLNVFSIVKIRSVKFILPFFLISASPILVSTVNYTIEKSFELSKGSHVFFVGKLLDSGVLKSFLDDKCIDNNYALCACKDSLPKNSRDFLWSGNSPLYKDGGWEKSSEKYNKIIADVFKSPKHSLMFISNSISSTFAQLFQNEIGSGLISNWYSEPGSPPYEQVAKHFPNELNVYNISRQNSNLWGQGLNFDLINHINYLLLVASILFIIMIFYKKSIWQNIKQETKCLLAISLVGIFINAFVTATFANIYDRLQARISWLYIALVFFIMISEYQILFSFIKEKRNKFFEN